MELTPFVEGVRQELLVASQSAGESGRQLAERLVAQLDSTIRLTLLSALSTAADEITQELAPGSVEVRLRGLEPRFVVTAPPIEDWDRDAAVAPTVMPSMAPPIMPTMAPPGAPPPALAPRLTSDEESSPARINFRPPEQLKTRIEAAAGREGLSVNAWLVRAIGSVLDASPPTGTSRTSSGTRSYSGWVR